MIYFTDDDKYDNLIKAIAQEEGVNPALVKGIIGAESAFKAGAILWEPSHSRIRQEGDTDASRGLMQVTEGAAKTVGYAGSQTFDLLMLPQVGVRYGIKVLKRFLDNPYANFYKGPPQPGQVPLHQPRVTDAVAAYNMGYPRAIGWTTEGIASLFRYPMTYKDAPPPGWIYANQPYVDKVLAFSALYEADFAGDKEAVAERLAEIKRGDLWQAAQRFGVYGVSILGVLAAVWAVIFLIRKRKA
jgi:soluble lytic murein transglycosylase-like protein